MVSQAELAISNIATKKRMCAIYTKKLTNMTTDQYYWRATNKIGNLSRIFYKGVHYTCTIHYTIFIQ